MGQMDAKEMNVIPDRKEMLAFRLGQEEYGIDILAVREIRAYERPTRIVNAPPFIIGVINLRGTIVPIVDLRIWFDTGSVTDACVPALIIVDVAGRALGIVVDAVSDVLSLSPGDLRPLPQLSSSGDKRFIQGLASVDGRLVILTDIAALLASPEMALVDAPVPPVCVREMHSPQA